MTDQDNGQVSTLQRPTIDDKDAWKAYWKSQGWPWRTEPEIDADRQKYLAERRAIVPDIEKCIYPFKDIKLSRADIEWLLVTHGNGRGPVDWSDVSQRGREGLDLRAAILVWVDLSNLPLACIRGGITSKEYFATTSEQREMAAVHLEGAKLNEAFLERAILSRAHLEGAALNRLHLEGANLKWIHLEGADLLSAHLEQTVLQNAFLNGKDMEEEELNCLRQWEPDLKFPNRLNPASLRYAYMDRGTNLDSITLGDKKHGFVSLADIRWGDVSLELVEWSKVDMLGDEYTARQQKTIDGKKKERDIQKREIKRATRANRQLANALQNQGLNEDAARFAYRAQKLQRVVLRMQKKFGQYLFSGFLDLLAGYGYRPGRSVLWYLAVILGFALTYFAIGHLPFFPDAFVFSLTSFHGRGFFPGLGNATISLHNPLVILAAFEAVIGLLIEISFIATFTQRFFGR